MTRAVLALLLAVPLAAIAAPPQTFATPEAAVDAFVAALKAENAEASLLALFGDEHKDAIVEPDRAVRSANRAKIARRAADASACSRSRAPIAGCSSSATRPGRFRFRSSRPATAGASRRTKGIEELINRRIGGNERNAIYVLRAYIDAQRAYAAKDRDGDGVLQYAQKVMSSPGKQDGLYWPADAAKGEEPSPFGPLIAEAAPYIKGHVAGDPYRGYYFRILTQQGKNAAGGAYSYVINGRMIAGFAMIAYPAVYGETGVKTFIVNHNGTVYERDLGPNTAKLAARHQGLRPRQGVERREARIAIHSLSTKLEPHHAHLNSRRHRVHLRARAARCRADEQHRHAKPARQGRHGADRRSHAGHHGHRQGHPDAQDQGPARQRSGSRRRRGRQELRPAQGRRQRQGRATSRRSSSN